MRFFPFFTNIEGRKALIVGGGSVALRKIEKLLPFKPEITVCAPEINEKIESIEGIKIKKRRFSADMTDGAAFVIAATDDRETNREISRICHEKNIPVNVVDDPELCNFLFPALVNRGKMTVGISTAGASPLVAKKTREAIEKLLPEDLAELLEHMEKLRPAVKAGGGDAARRGKEFEKEYEKYLQNRQAESEIYPKVSIVGAGCGDAGLITVRGLDRIKNCEVLLYDDLIDNGLLQFVPANSEIIYMGKRSGKHSASQNEICRTIAEYALQGKRVVRLKGGDPFVFGRGGEEAITLKEMGIDYEIIPGISSSIAIPEMAGIPVTHRGVSRSFHVITAHTADTEDGLPEDFDTLAGLGGTIVILMGLGKLEQIAKRLIGAGKDGETPTAVISGGNSRNPATVRAPLSEIAQKVTDKGLKAPAVIVIGETAGMQLLPEMEG